MPEKSDSTLVDELMQLDDLSTWEAEFLENTHVVLASGRHLTPKQSAKLHELYAKRA